MTAIAVYALVSLVAWVLLACVLAVGEKVP